MVVEGVAGQLFGAVGIAHRKCGALVVVAGKSSTETEKKSSMMSPCKHLSPQKGKVEVTSSSPQSNPLLLSMLRWLWVAISTPR